MCLYEYGNGTSGSILVILAIIADRHRQYQENRTAMEVYVTAINAAITEFRTGRFHLGSREQAVLNLCRRTEKVCKNSSGLVEDRLREILRIARELGGVLENHNRDHADNQISHQIIRDLKK